MGGFFGVVSKFECSRVVYYGTDYHSHLGSKRGGIAIGNWTESEDDKREKRFEIRSIIHDIRNTQFRAKFDCELPQLRGNTGIGVISDYDEQPLTIYSRLGTYSLVTVGRINNLEELVKDSFNDNHSGHFLGMNGGIINPTELIATLINQKKTFAEGIKYAMSRIRGSCSLMIMVADKLYVARDRYGRTPVFIGKSEECMGVTMEDSAFLNLGLQMVHELKPAEIVELTPEGYNVLNPPEKGMQFCAFFWVYFGYPSSAYEGRSTEVVRMRNGRIMYDTETKVEVDYVCGIPDSGVGHAIGFSNASGQPYGRPLVKYTPTWARSFMPASKFLRELVAKMKLIPVEELIKGKNLLFCDDSIVRGNQLRTIIHRLKNIGANNIHIRMACPPLLYGCPFLNFSRAKSELDLIARRVIKELEPNVPEPDIKPYLDPKSEKYQQMVAKICEQIGATTLEFQTLEGLIKAIDLPREQICTYCWDGNDPYNQK